MINSISGWYDFTDWRIQMFHCSFEWYNCVLVCQKQVPSERTSNHIPQYLWDVCNYLSPFFIPASGTRVLNLNEDNSFDLYSSVTVYHKRNSNNKIFVVFYPVRTLKYVLHNVFIYFFFSNTLSTLKSLSMHFALIKAFNILKHLREGYWLRSLCNTCFYMALRRSRR